MRLIDADGLNALIGDERAILHNEQRTFKAMSENEFSTRDYMLSHFQYLIDNAPTVEQPTGQVNCSHCDYLNFSKKIIDIIVEVMTKYGIENVEDLQRELDRYKKGAEQ